MEYFYKSFSEMELPHEDDPIRRSKKRFFPNRDQNRNEERSRIFLNQDTNQKTLAEDHVL